SRSPTPRRRSACSSSPPTTLPAAWSVARCATCAPMRPRATPPSAEGTANRLQGAGRKPTGPPVGLSFSHLFSSPLPARRRLSRLTPPSSQPPARSLLALPRFPERKQEFAGRSPGRNEDNLTGGNDQAVRSCNSAAEEATPPQPAGLRPVPNATVQVSSSTA